MSRNLTWREVARLDVGARVVFPKGWEVFPYYSFTDGTTGTVKDNDLHDGGQLYSSLWVLPDDEAGQKALDDWGGEIQLSPELAGDNSLDDTSPVALEGSEMDPRPVEHWQEIFDKLPSPEGISVEKVIANRIIADLVGYRWNSKDRPRDIDELANALVAYYRLCLAAEGRT